MRSSWRPSWSLVQNPLSRPATSRGDSDRRVPSPGTEPTIVARRHSDMLTKASGKVALMCKARGQRDFRQRHVCAGKQLLGSPHALPYQIVVRRDAHGLPEGTHEVADRQVCEPCQQLHADPSFKIVVDIFAIRRSTFGGNPPRARPSAQRGCGFRAGGGQPLPDSGPAWSTIPWCDDIDGSRRAMEAYSHCWVECRMPNAPDEPPVVHIVDHDASLRSALDSLLRQRGPGHRHCGSLRDPFSKGSAR
jgi:hypothetical protein